jgi:hypothetical protein
MYPEQSFNIFNNYNATADFLFNYSEQKQRLVFFLESNRAS